MGMRPRVHRGLSACTRDAARGRVEGLTKRPAASGTYISPAEFGHPRRFPPAAARRLRPDCVSQVGSQSRLTHSDTSEVSLSLAQLVRLRLILIVSTLGLTITDTIPDDRTSSSDSESVSDGTPTASATPSPSPTRRGAQDQVSVTGQVRLASGSPTLRDRDSLTVTRPTSAVTQSQ